MSTQSRHHAICAHYVGHSLCSVRTTHLVFPLCAHARSILTLYVLTPSMRAQTKYAQSVHKVHTRSTHKVHASTHEVYSQYTQSKHKVRTKYCMVTLCCSVLHCVAHCNTLQHSTHKVNTKYAQSIVWSLCLRRDCGIYSISEGRNLYCLHFGISQFMRPEAHSWIFVRVQLG